jgi:hypothetical protein
MSLASSPAANVAGDALAAAPQAAYVAGIYVASLRMTEEILREREPEIAARLAEPD